MKTQESSFYIAGVRPAAMWVCVASLAYSGIGISILSWISSIFGMPPLPIMDITTQNNLLTALLGLGGMRSLEKIKDVATKKIG